jgi:uncharacterized membrane protein (UPF0127 family)
MTCRADFRAIGWGILWLSLLLLARNAWGGLPTHELQLGDKTLTVEVAATPASRSQGLMFRESLPDDHGMLFVWPREQRIAMWMKNTPIPLSVAFIDREFRILNIAHMEPFSTRAHASSAPALFALEVPRGWFGRNGIAAGDALPDLDRLMHAVPAVR